MDVPVQPISCSELASPEWPVTQNTLHLLHQPLLTVNYWRSIFYEPVFNGERSASANRQRIIHLKFPLLFKGWLNSGKGGCHVRHQLHALTAQSLRMDTTPPSSLAMRQPF